MTMTQCPTCSLWLPAGHVHSQAECDAHVRGRRIVQARADAWRRRYAVRGNGLEQLALDILVRL